MERIEKIQAEVASLQARYSAEINREIRDCIGSALDAWNDVLKWAMVDAGIMPR